MADNDYIQTKQDAAKNAGFTCVEAEENILRRMILRQGVAEDVVNELSQHDFSDIDYGKLFSAIKALVSEHKQVSIVTVDAKMNETYGADGWKAETLIRATRPTDHTISSWQDIKDIVVLVRNLSVRRQAIAKMERLVDNLRNPTSDVRVVLSDIGNAADGINAGGGSWVGMSDVLLNTYSYIERRQKGEIKCITSGLKCLDSIIGGFFQGEMTVIAARPSVGKSAFGVNIALAAANKGNKVGIVSGEMQDVGLGQRLLSHGAWVDGMKIRRTDIDEEAWEKLADAMADMSELPIKFLFDCLAIEDVVNEATQLARKGELDLLVVDYLQYLEARAPFKEERLKVAYISHSLKKLAKQAHIPVIVLAQVTRQGEGVMPTMKMLMESGNIEQDADGIIFLHRPNSIDDPSVNPDHKVGWDNWMENDTMYLSIGIAKQRNGAIGKTNVLFDAGLMRYIEIVKD